MLRGNVLSALRAKKAKKNGRTMNLIGCSVQFLIGYLEGKFQEGMNWDNHGTTYDIGENGKVIKDENGETVVQKKMAY